MKKTMLWTLLLIISGFAANAQALRFTPDFAAILDSAQAPRLLKQCSRSVPDKITSYWIPAQADTQALNDNFKRILNTHFKPADKDATVPVVKTLAATSFQYLGVIIHGRKFIYINAFPADEAKELSDMHIDPSKSAVIVCDGGSGFWGVLFDPETKQFSQLAING